MASLSCTLLLVFHNITPAHPGLSSSSPADGERWCFGEPGTSCRSPAAPPLRSAPMRPCRTAASPVPPPAGAGGGDQRRPATPSLVLCAGRAPAGPRKTGPRRAAHLSGPVRYLRTGDGGGGGTGHSWWGGGGRASPAATVTGQVTSSGHLSCHVACRVCCGFRSMT